MMDNCVFCEIIAGRLDASIVYEDDATFACMDLRQPTAAHLLVIPRQHVETIYDLEPETAARLMQAAVRVARAVRRALGPSGLSLWQSNGAAAGQEVPHVHVHLFTREPGDGFLRVYPAPPAHPDRPALDRLARQVRRALAEEA